MNHIGKELAKTGKPLGMCAEYYKEVKSTNDKDKLIGLYLSPKGLEFCLPNDIPAADYIRNNFKGTIEKHGVHIDEEVNIQNERKLILLGKCSGIIDIDGFNVCELFLKHESDVVLVTRGNSFVMVEMYDNSNLHIISGDTSKVCVKLIGSGDVSYEKCQKSAIKIMKPTSK